MPRRYTVENSEPACAEFLSRHINLVYAAALRRLGGDSHHAGDVTQHTFISVAENARNANSRATQRCDREAAASKVFEVRIRGISRG